MTESNSSLAKQSSVQPGTLLADKYRLEFEIGRGAMGTVWSALHLTLDQRVAIKIISREHATSTELRRRFSTEAKAAARLRSRYVVGVYDDGETPDGLPYIVMEYLEGECLEDRIARCGSIPLAEATRIAKHIGRALSRAHSRGIIHRDLKPANVFITQSEDDDEFGWIAKVLDFGIAKMEDYGEKSTTKTGTVLGTPLFMSPEQVRGASSVDHRADLYSLGMVVYNMVTGTYAFDGASFGDLLVSICTEPLPSLRDAAPWVPPSLEQWFEKACARDPEDRFAHADEMVEALAEAAGVVSGRHSMVEGSLPGASLSSYAQTQAAAGVAPRKLTETAPSYATAKSVAGLSSASPAIMTVHQAPTKSKVPWLVAAGVGFVGLTALVVVSTRGAEPGASAGRSQVAPSQPSSGVREDVVAPLASPARTEEAAAKSSVEAPPSATPAPTSEAAPLPAASAKPPKTTQPTSKPPKAALVKTPTQSATPPSKPATQSSAKAAPEKVLAPPSSKPAPVPDLGF